MKHVFTFSKISYGSIDIEADSKPDNCDIIERILQGRANYNGTDFRLAEVDGKPRRKVDESMNSPTASML